MGVLDWILLVIRWGHAVAAVAWVGGGIFYLMVLLPALRRNSLSPEANRSVGVEFRGLVNTAIAVLLLTGVILSVARLTEDSITIPYVAVLVVKIVLALYMFYVVRFLRPATYSEGDRAATGWLGNVRAGLTSAGAVLIIGLIVIGLADVLAFLFEDSLRQ